MTLCSTITTDLNDQERCLHIYMGVESSSNTNINLEANMLPQLGYLSPLLFAADSYSQLDFHSNFYDVR